MRVEPSSDTLRLAIQFHRSSSGGFPRNWLRHFGTPSTRPAEAPHTPLVCPQVPAVEVVPMAAVVAPVRVLRKATLDRVLIPGGERPSHGVGDLLQVALRRRRNRATIESRGLACRRLS